jgi:hypothetical protein
MRHLFKSPKLSAMRSTLANKIYMESEVIISLAQAVTSKKVSLSRAADVSRFVEGH